MEVGELESKLESLEEKKKQAYDTYVSPIVTEIRQVELDLLVFFRKKYPVLWFIVGKAHPTVPNRVPFDTIHGGPYGTEEEAEEGIPKDKRQVLSHHVIYFSVMAKSSKNFGLETFRSIGKTKFYYYH